VLQKFEVDIDLSLSIRRLLLYFSILKHISIIAMDELLIQIAAEKKISSDLQVSLDEEIALRLKAEASLHDLRKVLETMANRGEMEEEKIVNKV
jgi:hypothetical protein